MSAHSQHTRNVTLDTETIKTLIPHREPMLMVDRVTDIDPDVLTAVGYKYVDPKEDHFRGHFPGHPIMPGVLIIEAMAQSAAVMVVHCLGEEAKDKLVYFMSVEDARFRNPVYPDCELKLEVRAVRNRGTVWKFEGRGMVDGKLCAEAIFTAMIMDRDEKENT